METVIQLQIKLFCKCCGKVHTLPRTSEIPDGVTALACNFCIECEDKMNNYYNEWYIEESELPQVENPNQLTLFPDEIIRALWWNQPYASLMLYDKIETRNRPTKVRGKVLICSCKKAYTQDQVDRISGLQQSFRINDMRLSYPLGEAIAIADLVDCRPMTPADEDKCFVDYHPGLWCWVFRNVHQIYPFPIKGKQGWSILGRETKAKIKIK